MKSNIKTIIISIVCALVIVFIAIPRSSEVKEQKESTYDRIMRTGTIRCGYFNWYPGYIKDPKTGEASGINYEVVNEMAKNLNLKVEWAEEIPLADYSAAVESQRVDAICATVWPTSARAKAMDFIDPFVYLPLYAYSRIGDNRFINDVEIANSSEYTIAVLEGGATESIQRQLFPNATVLTLPSLTSPSELFLTLQTGKADIVIYDSFTYGKYNDTNPNKIQQASEKPLKVFPVVMGIKKDEYQLQRLFNNALTEVQLTGTLDKIVKKHEKYPNAFRYRRLPYEEK